MSYKPITAVLVLGICVLSMAVARGVNESKKNTSPSETSDLKDIVAILTARVAALEKRIQTLEASQQRIVIGRSMVPDRKTLPKGWQQREFNGIPYYIVPLDQRQPTHQQSRPAHGPPK